MAMMKPLGAKWLLNVYKHLLTNKEIIPNEFKAAGIVDTLKEQ